MPRITFTGPELNSIHSLALWEEEDDPSGKLASIIAKIEMLNEKQSKPFLPWHDENGEVCYPEEG